MTDKPLSKEDSIVGSFRRLVRNLRKMDEHKPLQKDSIYQVYCSSCGALAAGLKGFHDKDEVQSAVEGLKEWKPMHPVIIDQTEQCIKCKKQKRIIGFIKHKLYCHECAVDYWLSGRGDENG